MLLVRQKYRRWWFGVESGPDWVQPPRSGPSRAAARRASVDGPQHAPVTKFLASWPRPRWCSGGTALSPPSRLTLRHTPRATSGWFVYGLLSIRAAAPLAHLQAAARAAGPDGVVTQCLDPLEVLAMGPRADDPPVVGVRLHRIASTPEVRRHR